MNYLDLKKRELTAGYSARRERRAGFVPGVLYGKKAQNLLFEIGALELGKGLSQVGDHGIVDYTMDGESHKALLREVQRDPVTHKIIHIDLEQIKADDIIQSEVPIQYIGEEWINNNGAVLQKEKAAVKVSCTADDLPKSIKIDVSNGEVGSVYRVSDIEIAPEISIIDDIKSVIASVSNERKLVSQLGEEEKETVEDKKE